ncbi:PEP-CTERM sorting domain-containing protein [Paucibacter sp. B2R-40]|uniref:PEP-CTERM sorting domain-containing protein n=1 Tax=Paucibacter sp. B2R-40 TaxID=2893554 RepID=UPI0021E39593|nr:PEP-CTERM sorting domain-containing protein [Paucibacter sp. B2R-40]MCV2353084.1 PEP-CTERM sorting domain-containing protein [Paucibacter sp. B2R-40]
MKTSCDECPSVPAFRLTLIAAAVWLLHAAPAQAATFEGAIIADGVTQVSSAPSNQVSGYDYSSSYSGYADYGQSRVNASSSGQPLRKEVETVLTFHQTVVNPYASAQNVSFSFNIPRSRTSISLGSEYSSAPNLLSFSAAASLMGDISWGGASVWNVSYGVSGSGSVANGGGSLNYSGLSSSASASGFTVGALAGPGVIKLTGDGDLYDPATGTYLPGPHTGLVGGAYVTSDNYQGLLNLGTIGANESLELTYTLKATASFEGTYIVNSGSDCYGGYGGACAQAGGYDPFGIDFEPEPNNGGITLNFTAAVPEPSTYALMLGGLGLLAWSSRRQAGKQ